MNYNQAKGIVDSYNNAYKTINFSLNEKIFYGESYNKNCFKIYPAEIINKRISKIGLQPCYSLYNIKTEKIIHTSNILLFKDFKTAKNYMEALLFLKLRNN